MSNVKPSNRLALESSPYLLQHQYNPVNWYAWGQEAFNLARAANKPIFLSIGYSTCYWCHVMEKECFEDLEVAQALNKDFICIKVDREERPDVDQIYMDAVAGLTGHGGWPLSVFLTPNLEPFFGGTYFPKDSFLTVLDRLIQAWTQQHDAVLESAQGIVRALYNENDAPVVELSEQLFETAVDKFVNSFDQRFGGFGAAPKFPPSMQLAYLMRMHLRNKKTRLLDIVLFTLDKMARGGIYDHLGGGFARYATDKAWLIPHFEKMLYDNALLLKVYLEAFKLSGQNFLRVIAEETLQYVSEQMRCPTGGFYSAQDAGEAGAEGEFYVWSKKEIEDILSKPDSDLFCTLFGVSAEGNFEGGKNVLYLAHSCNWADRQDPRVSAFRQKLLARRKQRVAPRLDDKIITAWNALLVTALCKAAECLNDSKYLDLARETLLFIQRELMVSGVLYRSVCKGKLGPLACLEDYSYLIEALLNMHHVDPDSRWLDFANTLQQQQFDLFWDKTKGGFFFSQGPELVHRKKEIADNALPSANFVAALNLIRLCVFHGKTDLRSKIEQFWAYASNTLTQYPWACSSGLCALMLWLDSRVCTGPDCDLEKLNDLLL